MGWRLKDSEKWFSLQVTILFYFSTGLPPHQGRGSGARSAARAAVGGMTAVVVRAVERRARGRGLPLIVPLMRSFKKGVIASQLGIVTRVRGASHNDQQRPQMHAERREIGDWQPPANELFK